MQRILVTGIAGAGKTMLSLRLGKILNLPVIHLDRHFWQPGWKKMDYEKWCDKLRGLADGEKWIMDGNYDSSLEIRLPRCDTIIYLDFSRWLCLCRAVLRIFKNYGKIRPDMAPGCPERIDFTFFNFIWNFNRSERLRIWALIEKHRSDKEILFFTSRRQIETFLTGLEFKSNQV